MEEGHHIEPDFDMAVSANLGYGLDVSNPHYISYIHDDIVVEVLGGINDILPQSLKVTLKVYKQGAANPSEIYRSNQLDLFDDTQVTYTIQKISERLSVETTYIKNVVYDFIERLDHYRRHGLTESEPIINVTSSIKNEAKQLLQSDNIFESLKEILQQAGITDTRLGVQLFILSLSRNTNYPLHAIVQAPTLLAHTLINEFITILPTEQTIELTSISKHALSYAPSEDYWKNKTLVLHRLESIKAKEHSLLEYLLQGKSLRLVTGADRETGVYQSSQQNVTSSINLITHSSQDYHPLFKGKQSLCIPLGNIQKIQEKVYEQEVKQLAGLIDTENQKQAQKVLHQVARELKEYTIYNPIIEQVDLSVFFGTNHIELSKYLKLVNLITILHQYKQNPTVIKIGAQLEVKAAYMILALELFRESFIKEDKELYFNVESTFIRLKKHLKKEHTDSQSKPFTLRMIRRGLAMSPITLGKHIKTLELYGKLERSGGSNKTGFEYKITQWAESHSNTKSYHELLEQLKKYKNNEN